MQAVTNKQIATTLHKALPYIRTRRLGRGERFICYAIDETFQYNGCRGNPTPAIAAAKAVIQSRIAPFDTVESWLRSKGANVFDTNGWYLFHRLQTYRRAWVKQLIKEFEAK